MELQHYMMKFVSDLWQVAGFFLALRFPPPSIKLNPHDVTEILLKVTLNTIYLALITLFAWFTIPSRTVSIQRKSYSPQVCASSSSGKFSEKKVFMKKKKQSVRESTGIVSTMQSIQSSVIGVVDEKSTLSKSLFGN